MKDTGKTEKDMALALKPEADGFTEASGRKGLRDATVFDKAYHQQPDTKVHGPMVCRTATDQKHMQMEVRLSWECLILVPRYFNEDLIVNPKQEATKANGYAACDMAMVCALRLLLAWLLGLEPSLSEHR